MRQVSVLLCLILVTSGCSAVSDIRDGLSLPPPKTSPVRKASLTSPQKALTKPDSGPGEPSKATTVTKCPDVDPAAREALERPAPLPPAKPLLSPNDVKRWIEASEDQIKGLKDHLRSSTTALSACHAKS